MAYFGDCVTYIELVDGGYRGVMRVGEGEERTELVYRSPYYAQAAIDMLLGLAHWLSNHRA